MSKIKLKHSSGNSMSIAAPATNPAADRTINLNDNYAGDGSFVTANSSGNVGIGDATPTKPLTVGTTTPVILLDDQSSRTMEIRGGSTSYNPSIITTYASDLVLGTNSTERLRITSAGNLHVGRNTDYWSSRATFQEDKNGRTQVLVKNDNNHADASSCVALNAYGNSWTIDCGSSSKNSNALTFNLDASSATPTEKVRITSGGQLNIGTTVDALGVDTGNNTGCNLTSGGRIYVKSNDHSEWNIIDGGAAIRWRYGNTSGSTQTQVGQVTINSSSTTYSTSSDYRLKDNVVAISDGITRLKTLKPYRFNFKVDPDTTVDGFFAHEVTPVVPEAIVGTKDEVDSDDNPVYQGIDQSKLVPLLTAALQEAITKIETLETKVAALEAA